MIPERSTIEVNSTVSGEDVAMSIDQSALAHIMNVLTDLYSDPELAVIREYATNALDSHIEAGQTRPIEVSTPTDLRPLFTVRDYGIGMDADTIRDIYSRYGASTKRQSNDAVGMLGLGCKSALAYVDQFTLTGIKDGQRMQVSIARDETGAGTMTVLESGPTDGLDGVEVAIPVKPDNELELKAEEFFSYWAPGTVLLNGEAPAALEGYAVGDIYTVADYAAAAYYDTRMTKHNKLLVVMGNVAYPAPDGFAMSAVESLPGDKRLVVRVPIGAVHFTPSREGLQDSDRTRDALVEALEGFADDVTDAVRSAVEGADSRPAAARALIEARAAFGKKNVGDLQWHGEDIPVTISAEDCADLKTGGKPSIWRNAVVNNYRGSRTYRNPAGQITLDDAGALPWIVGFDNSSWTAPMRRKFERYMEYNELWGSMAKQAIFITNAASVPRPDWIDGAVTQVAWETVRDWKDPEAVKGGGSGGGGIVYAGTYPTLADGRWTEKFPADDLPKSGRKLYYFEGAKWDERARAASLLLADDAYVVCVTEARAAKFKRLFPHARPAMEAVRKGAAGWLASLGADSRAALALGPDLRYRHVGPLALPADRVDDPDLARLCRIYKLWERGDLQQRFAARSHFIDAPTLESAGLEGWAAVIERYPLVDDTLDTEISRNMEHVLLYVNAAYAANKMEA